MYDEFQKKLSESWMEKKQTGWPLSVDVTDIFRSYCDDVGMEYAKSQEGAMLVWIHLPASVQRLACLQASGKIPAVDSEFWKKYLEGLTIEVPLHEANLHDKMKKK